MACFNLFTVVAGMCSFYFYSAIAFFLVEDVKVAGIPFDSQGMKCFIQSH